MWCHYFSLHNWVRKKWVTFWIHGRIICILTELHMSFEGPIHNRLNYWLGIEHAKPYPLMIQLRIVSVFIRLELGWSSLPASITSVSTHLIPWKWIRWLQIDKWLFLTEFAFYATNHYITSIKIIEIYYSQSGLDRPLQPLSGIVIQSSQENRSHGPLASYVKLRARMRRECRERFPRHRR